MRYRPAARRPQMVDTGMSHFGFRCVTRPTISTPSVVSELIVSVNPAGDQTQE